MTQHCSLLLHVYTSARVYVINANKRHTTKLHLPASHVLIPVDVLTRFSVSVQSTRRIQWSLVAGRQKWSRNCVDQGRHWMSMCRQLPAVLQSVSYGHCFYTASKTALSLYSLHCDNKTVTDLTGCFKQPVFFPVGKHRRSACSCFHSTATDYLKLMASLPNICHMLNNKHDIQTGTDAKQS